MPPLAEKPRLAARLCGRCEGCPDEDRCPECPDRPAVTPGEPGREVVVALREEGHSFRAIGNALGVADTTALRDFQSTAASAAVPERIVGLDGRSRPARSSPDPEGAR